MSRVTNFLVGRVLAQNANVDPTRPSLVAALVPNAVTAVVLAQLIVRSEVAALPLPSGTTTGTGGAGGTGGGTGAGGGTITQVAVPDLAGETVAGATDRLRQVGLVSAGVTGGVEADEARGRVVATSPAAGVVVARGSGVTLFVSAGPPVPDVVGQHVEAAVEELAQSRYSASVTRRPGDPAEADRVAEQTPIGGEYPAEGSTTVQLVVNGRADAVVPDLTGMRPNDARDALQVAGLRGLVAGRYRPSDDDVVVQQDPAAYSLVESESAVTLTFGQPLGGDGPVA